MATVAYKRRIDGVVFGVDHPTVTGLSCAAREALFDTVDEQGRSAADARREREEQLRVEAEAAAQAERDRLEAGMTSDVVPRPVAKRMSRDQLLVDLGRAVHAAFPTRADDIISELEKRLPDHELCRTWAWDEDERRWVPYPEADDH